MKRTPTHRLSPGEILRKKRWSPYCLPVFLVGLFLAVPSLGFGNVVPEFPGDQAAEAPEIEITYDRLQMFMDEQLLILSGHVNIIYQDLSISADEITIDLEQNLAEAHGNVIFWRGGQQWFGNSLLYDFDSGKMGLSHPSMTGDWIYFKSDQIQMLENGKRIIARDTELTTCDLEEPHYYYKVKKAVIDPGKRFWLYNGTLNVGKVPVAYFPFFSRSLDPQDPTWIFSPGYSKKKGAMALNRFAWTFNDYLHLRLSTDYYSKIGPGLGLHNRYVSPDRDNLEGFIYGYYLFGNPDNDYVQGPPDTAVDIDDDRWKIAGQHWQRFGDKTTLTARYQFLSDPEYNEDFADQEILRGFGGRLGGDLMDYERNSFVNLAHRDDFFNYRITAKVSEQELFDNEVFQNEYPEEQRLPQIRIDGRRTRLFDTPLYLKTGAEFTHFKQEQQLLRNPNTWLMTQESDRAEFDAELSYPVSLPWGLRLIPSLAYQATYYGDSTREFRFNDQDGTAPNRDGDYREEYDDNLFRHLGTAGVELVDRVVVSWDQPEQSVYPQMRLVTEPRIGFFYREPSIDFEDENPERIVNNLAVSTNQIPFSLGSFLSQPYDRWDAPLRTEKQLEFHLETKLEGKKASGEVYRFAKHSFAVAYDFEPEHDHWTEMISELWLYPHSRVDLHSYLRYDWNEGELLQSNSSIGIRPWDRISLSAGISTYKLTPKGDDQEDLVVSLNCQLNDKYSIEYQHRRDLDESETRENRLTITRDMHDLLGCLILREKNYDDEDYEFEIQGLFILKFPTAGKAFNFSDEPPES